MRRAMVLRGEGFMGGFTWGVRKGVIEEAGLLLPEWV